ncbi:5234_t:CDS:1, partial [Acaulospora morrowiae]
GVHSSHRHANRNHRNGDLKRQLQMQQQTKYKLDFEVEDLYTVGSPIGLFLLLKGTKIGSRNYYHEINKISESRNWEDVSLDNPEEKGNDGIPGRKNSRSEFEQWEQRSMLNNQVGLIPLCHPAVKNIYNVFHKS